MGARLHREVTNANQEPRWRSNPDAYRVAAVQMEPKLGRLDANLEQILNWLEPGGRWRGAPGCLSGVRPLRLWLFQPRRGACSCRPARQRAGAQGGRGLRAASVFLPSSDCWSATATAVQCLRAGRSGRRGRVAIARFICRFWGSTCSSIPGDRPFAVHDAGGLKVGMHICYDGGFPETARVLTLLGADLLVLPTNWPTHSECAAEHMIPTRAMENTVYVMAVNRVGEESGFRFIGTQLDRRPQRARAGAGRARIQRRSSRPTSTRPARGRSTWSASPAGTRSTGSPTAGRGFTRSWSRHNGRDLIAEIMGQAGSESAIVDPTSGRAVRLVIERDRGLASRPHCPGRVRLGSFGVATGGNGGSWQRRRGSRRRRPSPMPA